jgi:hypothetical protein
MRNELKRSLADEGRNFRASEVGAIGHVAVAYYRKK